MSWGERSCTQFGSCKHKPTMSSCNVDCQFYVWDEKTTPDSTKHPLMPSDPRLRNEDGSITTVADMAKTQPTSGDFVRMVIKEIKDRKP